jgi:hypothetical protein
MEWHGLAEDFGKFALTAIVSFVASLLYTEYRVKPEHNVNLVPLVMQKYDACEVNGKKLKEVLDDLPSEDEEEGLQKGTYRSYLQTLEIEKASRTDKSRMLVEKEFIPEAHFAQLEQDEILKCVFLDPDGKPDLRYHTFLVVHVALFINEPFAYVLRRSCSLGYKNKEIPLRAYLEELPQKTLGKSEAGLAPEILIIEKTRPLVLTYDMKEAGEVDPRSFAELTKKMDEGKVDVTIKCIVVEDRGERSIGRGKPYTVSIRTFL